MITESEKKQKTNTFDVTPSYKLLDTMGYGSYSIQTAIADIVDNSITAKAHTIEINFVWEEEHPYVEIKDDGYGMSSKELENAMIFSGKGTKDFREEDDLGKYGLGMKTASMYACRCLTVISKKEGFPITSKMLDRDIVDEQEKWVGLNLDFSPELNKLDLKKGTIVRWDKLSFIEKGINSKNYFFKHVRDVHDHLAITFHRFIEKGLIMKINGNIVEPWNPICQHEATTKFDSQKLIYHDAQVNVSSYILPSSLSCNENEVDYIYRGNALKYQGFFVYRNDRLLVDGGWLNIQKGNTKLSTHQSYNAVRIIVDIPTSLDSSFKVDFTKSTLQFPIEIEEQLYKIATKVRKKAKELSRKRTYTPLKPGEKLEEIWKVKRTGDDYSFSINKNHPLIKRLTKNMDNKDLSDLIKILSKTVPLIGSERKFTGVFTVEEMDCLIQAHYVEQLAKNKAQDVIYSEMINMEPFNQYRELVNAFFEKIKTQNSK